jgi:hypothetical protein
MTGDYDLDAWLAWVGEKGQNAALLAENELLAKEGEQLAARVAELEAAIGLAHLHADEAIIQALAAEDRVKVLREALESAQPQVCFYLCVERSHSPICVNARAALSSLEPAPAPTDGPWVCPMCNDPKCGTEDEPVPSTVPKEPSE